MRPVIIPETILRGLSKKEQFEIISKAGFDTVELWDVGAEEAPAIKKMADDCGLQIIGLSGDITPYGNDPPMLDYRCQDKYCSMVENIMDIAKVLGATYLHCHSGKDQNALGLTSEEKFASMVSALKRLAPRAEKEGLVLLVENCETEWDSPGYFLDQAEKVSKLIRMVGSPNVRFIYDLYHEQVMRGNLIKTLRDNIDIIPYIHVSNVPHKCDLEDGEINYQTVASVIKELKFDGPLGFEVISGGKYEKTFEQVRRFIAQIQEN